MWEVLREILDTHVVAPSAPGASSSYAGRFAAARARFGDGLVTLSDLDYYPVDLLPADVAASSSWTPLTLGPERIAELAASLPKPTTEWLAAFNLLDELGDALVTSVQLETLPVTVVRSWLDEELFTWPFWTMPGEPVSDSVDPAVGRMPHYVGDLVAVRNLVVTLGDTELPSSGGPVVYRTVPGPSSHSSWTRARSWRPSPPNPQRRPPSRTRRPGPPRGARATRRALASRPRRPAPTGDTCASTSRSGSTPRRPSPPRRPGRGRHRRSAPERGGCRGDGAGP